MKIKSMALSTTAFMILMPMLANAAPSVSTYTAVPSNVSATIYTGSKPSMLVPAVFTQASFNAADAGSSNATKTTQAQFQLTIQNNSGSEVYVLVMPASGSQTDNLAACKVFSNMNIQYVNSQSATCFPTPAFSSGSSSYNLYISESPFSAVSPNTSADYQGLPFQCSPGLGVVLRSGTNSPYRLTNGSSPYALDLKAGSCSIGQS